MSDLRPLSSALAKKAAAELNEESDVVPHKLQALRDWVLMQPHLKSRVNDQFLIAFLRAAKFSLENAKRRLENYYVYRNTMPEVFRERDCNDPIIPIIIEAGSALHLAEPIAPDGPRVIMLRVSQFDMKRHTIPDVFKVGSMATDLLLSEDDNAIVAGYIVVMDIAHLPKAVLRNFDPNFARKMTIVANKISPTRMKGFHFLNAPPIFEKLFNMVKSVINEKLRERFYVYSNNNLEEFYKHVPQHILPKEYGGNFDVSSSQKYWLDRLLASKDFFEEEKTYGVIEGVGKQRKFTDLLISEAEGAFGVEGSFRKLNLD